MVFQGLVDHVEETDSIDHLKEGVQNTTTLLLVRITCPDWSSIPACSRGGSDAELEVAIRMKSLGSFLQANLHPARQRYLDRGV